MPRSICGIALDALKRETPPDFLLDVLLAIFVVPIVNRRPFHTSIRLSITEMEPPATVEKHMEVDKEKAELAAKYAIEHVLPARMTSILLVDDNRDTRLVTKWFLDYVGYVIHACSSAEDAMAQFDPNIHDLVVTDNSMPGMTGAELAHIIKLRSPSTPVVMYTGAPPADRSCLDAVVQRPTPLPVLKETIDRFLAPRP
jgi:CheY-like chemotaxis protein